MKNIRSYDAAKYSTDDYEKIEEGIYRTTYVNVVRDGDLALKGLDEGDELEAVKVLTDWKKFDDEEAVFRATETRSSSPVRILRDPGSLEAIDRPGIFPGGEGAGYAGGITSSACDGIRIAEQIIRKWEKPQG